MKLKYRFKSAVQFLAFSFYPKKTLIICTVVSVIAIALLGLIMSVTEERSAAYNIVFALITGAVASFFVAIIVELSSNYRHNKLAWYELQEYYQCVTDHECNKRVLMHQTASKKAIKKAQDDFTAEKGYTVVEESEDADEDARPKDIIEATWAQLPKIIPILSDTLNNKKAFLTDTEIKELNNIILNHNQIKGEIADLLLMSPLLHNTMNHPDESFLYGMYPKNILSDMPKWVRKHLASQESQNAMDRLADTILSDEYLRKQFMKDYDISQNAIKNYHDPSDEQSFDDIGSDSKDIDVEYEYSKTEEEFIAENNALNKQIVESEKPLNSWFISRCCADIANSIEELEKSIIKKPYYSIHLKLFKKSGIKLDNPVTKAVYEKEKKGLFQLLERQENNIK